MDLLPPRTLYLIDAMALAYRSHFALMRNPIRTSSGMNTSAIFGFANVLEKIRNRTNATHLAVVWDTSAPTFRHQQYPEYKAQRESMPEELAEAIPHIKRWVQALDIPCFEQDGWEADDIIATLAKQAEQDNCEMCYLVTPDKDFAQLVSAQTQLLRPGRKGSEEEIWNIQSVCERWNIPSPQHVIDLLALMGDASDNIPGVHGVGEKTAAKLIQKHGFLTDILAAAKAGEIKGKLGENLVTYADQAILSYQLATIIAEAPVSLNWDQLQISLPNKEELANLCREFEFNSLGKTILGKDFHAGRSSAINKESATNAANPLNDELFAAPVETSRLDKNTVDYQGLQTPAEITAYLNTLHQEPQLCFDTETDGLNSQKANLLGIAFAHKSNQARFVLLPSATSNQRQEILNIIKDFFASYSGELIGHNLKFDLGVLFAHQIYIPNANLWDTYLVAGLLNITQKRSLDYLAESRLGYLPISYAELTGSTKTSEQTPLPQLLESAPEKVIDYACEDADITLQLAEILRPEIEAIPSLSNLLTTVEQPLTTVLLKMEMEGIRLNPDSLDEIRLELAETIQTISTEINSVAEKDLNLNSPKQLGEFLFDKLKLQEKPKKTKTGQYVTNEQVLSQLAQRHSIVAQILKYREASKLKNTYVDPLPEHMDAADQRIRTSFQQLAATTGRLASASPNLQNIPIRSELGKSVRRAFVAKNEQYSLLSADYSQIELRIMAHMSQDTALIQAFQENLDIHQATAAKVFGVATSDVLPEMRRAAKMVNFGIIYGISAFGLSQRLGTSRNEAQEIISSYWNNYPQVQAFMQEIVEQSRNQGYGETLFGRRCPMPDLNSKNRTVANNAERFAINMPIQGTAADIIKKAMIAVDELLEKSNAKTKLLLQVHDELVFDLAKTEETTLPQQIVTAMESAATLSVPLTVEYGIGTNWLAAH